MTNKSKVTIVAHNGQFHADDVFAVAALKLLVGDSKEVEVIRTRDGEIINSADYVVDVGGFHTPEKNRFDHHQFGGAGERANGVPFAAFGLVWQKFGPEITGSKVVAEIIDQRLVQSVDALDNGISVSKEIIPNLRPFDISSIIGAMNPNWDEGETEDKVDQIFLEATSLAMKILAREIQSAKSDFAGETFAVDAYKQSADKHLIILDRKYPFEKVLSGFPEPLFVVYPKQDKWYVKAIRKNLNTFENRKDLPASWGGKRGSELSAVTGIPGGIFCHIKLFTAGADSKDAAIAMAKVATEA